MNLLIALAALVQPMATAPAAPPAAPPATAAEAPAPSADDIRLATAAQMVASGQPAEAVVLADQIIASMEAAYPRRDDKVYFSAQSMAETLLYATMASAVKKNAIVLNGTGGTAYFLKAFALVDLNRGDQALTWLDKAIGLSPMNAQFLAERAEWYKSRRQWKKAFADFETARSSADLAPDDVRVAWQGRAIRDMAFVKVEQGKFGDAGRLLNEALRLNPSDQRARADLAELPSLKR